MPPTNGAIQIEQGDELTQYHGPWQFERDEMGAVAMVDDTPLCSIATPLLLTRCHAVVAHLPPLARCCCPPPHQIIAAAAH